MKTLRRSTTNRVIGGVCGGIAEYFSLDPVLIRLLFVVLAVFGGAGVILYIIAWIIMPEQSIGSTIQDAEIVDDRKKTTGEQLKDDFKNVEKELKQGIHEIEKEIKKQKHSSGVWFGCLLVFLGVAFLLREFGWINFSWHRIIQFWPILLILLGVSVMPMKRWLKNSLMILCLASLLVAMMCKPYSGRYYKRYSTYSVNVSRNVVAVTTSRESETAKIKVDAGACKLLLSETTKHLSALWLNGEEHSFVEFTDELEQYEKIKVQLFKGEFVNSCVDLALHENPIWDVELNVGAADVKMDFTPFKTKNVKINSGAADIDLTFGQKHPETKVNISTGASSIIIRIPKNADCQVISGGFLVDKTLSGFAKQGGVYKTENFGKAEQTITIKIDGAVSGLEVIRY